MRVLFSGASGMTGRATGAALDRLDDMEVVGGLGVRSAGRDLGEVWHGTRDGRAIYGSLAEAFDAARPDVLVDFTNGEAAEGHLKAAIVRGIRPVVGATGLSEEALREGEELSRHYGVPAAVIANFSIVSALLTRFALEALPHFEGAELIELHHARKLDRPSGTAKRLKERLEAVQGREVPVHSVRLQGFVAHQEVLFGTRGETLTIRHDAIDRSCYAAGVRLVALGLMERDGFYRDLQAFLPPGEAR